MTPQDVIKHFIQSAKNAMVTMCGMHEVQKKKIFLKRDSDNFGGICGVMGLSGHATGSFVLSLPKELAAKLAGNMLETAPNELEQSDVEDAVAEIVNLVSGNAKLLVSNTQFAFSISLPTVISGEQQRITWHNTQPFVGVQMEADGQDFVMYLSLAPKAKN